MICQQLGRGDSASVEKLDLDQLRANPERQPAQTPGKRGIDLPAGSLVVLDQLRQVPPEFISRGLAREPSRPADGLQVVAEFDVPLDALLRLAAIRVRRLEQPLAAHDSPPGFPPVVRSSFICFITSRRARNSARSRDIRPSYSMIAARSSHTTN